MARNANVTKLIKQRKEWRSKRPKTFIKVRGGVSKSDIPENQLGYFNYRHRGKFPQGAAPPTKGLSKESREVLASILTHAMGLSPKPDTFVYLEQSELFSVKLFFNTEKTTFFFVERKLQVERTSKIVHGNLNFAKKLYLSGRIPWDD